MEKISKDYQFRLKRGALVFRTSTYKAEEGSALHSGIYNRELTSSLASGSIMLVLALLAVYFKLDITKYHWVAAFLLFGVLFYLFRVHVFFEVFLELTVDREKGFVNIQIKDTLSKTIKRKLLELKTINKGVTILAPENPDGMEVVRKIALQHSMVLEDFGVSKEVHFVDLEFDDGMAVMVFASDDRNEVNSVVDIFNNFIGGGLAKKK